MPTACGISWARDWTCDSSDNAGCLTGWATRELLFVLLKGCWDVLFGLVDGWVFKVVCVYLAQSFTCIFRTCFKNRYSSPKYLLFFYFILGFFSFSFFFLGLHPWHMEVPRQGVESELRLPAYATASATRDLSHICSLHGSSRQRWIPSPLSEARERTRVLMDISWVR